MESQSSSSPSQSSGSSQTSKVLKWIGGVTALALSLGVVAVILYGYTATPGWVGVADKEFWDYLELLIVPVALASGVAWLSAAQRKRERETQVAQEERQRVAEEARKQRELEIESQRAQDEALQAYLDQMSQLLIDRDRPLPRARPGDNLSTVARAQTLTVLMRLDGDRKGRVVRFLYESGLITANRLVLDLKNADLREVNLQGIFLAAIHLYRADLSGANLQGASLVGALLERTDLQGANLQEATLHATHLEQANLHGANMEDAILQGAHLGGADLSGADLARALGFTEEELRAHAKSLEGAIMPNGQKYEDWLSYEAVRGEEVP